MKNIYINKKIPIAHCPECNRSIVYSSNGADKNTVNIQLAPHGYLGKTVLCAKCKSMLIITDKNNNGIHSNQIEQM